MEKPKQKNTAGVCSYRGRTCDNCGREIKTQKCPFCGFEYKEDTDENGIFYT